MKRQSRHPTLTHVTESQRASVIVIDRVSRCESRYCDVYAEKEKQSMNKEKSHERRERHAQ